MIYFIIKKGLIQNIKHELDSNINQKNYNPILQEDKKYKLKIMMQMLPYKE